MTAREVALRLKTVPHWSLRAQTIRRTYRFDRFLGSIDFVKRIARKAEESHHHPDIDIRYSRVTLKLTTHDAGGLTRKDFSLARECDKVYSRHFAT